MKFLKSSMADAKDILSLFVIKVRKWENFFSLIYIAISSML